MPRLRSRDSLGKLGFCYGPTQLSCLARRQPRRAETRTWQLPALPPRATRAHEENWLHNRMPTACLNSHSPPDDLATKILHATLFAMLLLKQVADSKTCANRHISLSQSKFIH